MCIVTIFTPEVSFSADVTVDICTNAAVVLVIRTTNNKHNA